MTPEPCCERDHDGDGNCDRHPSRRSAVPATWLHASRDFFKQQAYDSGRQIASLGLSLDLNWYDHPTQRVMHNEFVRGWSDWHNEHSEGLNP